VSGSKLLVAIVALVAIIVSVVSFCLAQEIKQPSVAGSFYPDNPAELSAMVDRFLQQADPQPLEGGIFALISPHAGYGYSGSVAAYGYKLVRDKPYKTAIIFGPAHHFAFSGIALYPAEVFRIPLGDIKVDDDFINKIADSGLIIKYMPEAYKEEHSIEVQLPFLQKVLPDCKIAPLLIGDCTLSECKNIAEVLREAIGERKDVLIIVSSDMYHGFDYEEAGIIDNLTLDYIKNMDAEGLYYGIREGKLQLCGGFGAVITLILAKEMGHDKVSVLKYTNSAQVTGKLTKGIWTVGYASCAIDHSAEREAGDMLNVEQRKRLLEIARNSIKTYLETGKKLEVKEADQALNAEMGVFVTLHEHGQLRGCIGNLIGRGPLYLTVRDMAVESATADPRFPPVELSELKDIDIEISALSPMQKIGDPEQIEMGKHGVLIRKGFRSGVYLPQVATETGWTREEFISSLCTQKVGLPADCWKDPATEVYIFTAEVFSEKNAD